MKYLVNFLTTANKQRSVVVTAENCTEAADTVSQKYPACTVSRISSDKNEIDYFTTVKKWKENTN